MSEVTKLCHDGGEHVFLKDGAGVSCAYCDCNHAAWLAAFYPDEAPAEASATDADEPRELDFNEETA